MKINVKALEEFKPRSKWENGVKDCVFDFIDDLNEDKEYFQGKSKNDLKTFLLNGADNWKQYAYGGCGLIYDNDIAQRFCTPSELKRTKNGYFNPNGRENWLDLYSRGLYQAFNMLLDFVDFE